MGFSTEASSPSEIWEEIYLTFLASIRSVGTACTLAGVGIYLHRRGFILGDGKRTLALISQQVTIPLLFFTKIINCDQNWSEDPCPDVTQSLRDIWVLLIWPLYVVGVGLSVGYCVAKISCTPKHQIRAVLAACGFGNSTGLPITLLSVVHSNFPATTDLGRVDPCMFLSVYLLLYPILQWGIGGWLLAPPEKEKSKRDQQKNNNGTLSSSLAHNVLNVRTDSMYNFTHRGIGETDASMYMSIQENLNQLGGFQYSRVRQEEKKESPPENSPHIGLELCSRKDVDDETPLAFSQLSRARSGIFEKEADGTQIGMDLSSQDDVESTDSSASESSALLSPLDTAKTSESGETNSSISDDDSTERENLFTTVEKVLRKCLQPPVIGALLGLLVAAIPRIRGLFVDLVDRSGDAPCEWFFDGLFAAGQAAVPINMIILGCNLSASYGRNRGSDDEEKSKLFSLQTTTAIVIGKMIVMPTIGFLSAFLFKAYVWDIPDDIDGSFYLVVLIVFLTPTANNVMVMVELGGGGAKEAIARTIAWQYAVAPIILSLTMTAAVGVANHWS